MDVNDNAGCLNARVVRTTIANELAPTVFYVFHTSIFVCGSLVGRKARA
ncbi:hypothetical protein SAMN04490195_4675 [Pseudomonas moorei]|jgi:hypothetical protein|uniref:Uncharacterized protein n=1 Tax=Pseudomonas moorei TaxID=395599 RepID=A0A1H1HYG3_9PSED|nr:hypothetical protein SAMN04490195_4675 [Pseudomonas moorei]